MRPAQDRFAGLLGSASLLPRKERARFAFNSPASVLRVSCPRREPGGISNRRSSLYHLRACPKTKKPSAMLRAGREACRRIGRGGYSSTMGNYSSIKTFLFASAVSILLCSGSEADDRCGNGSCCCGFMDSMRRTCYVCTGQIGRRVREHLQGLLWGAG